MKRLNRAGRKFSETLSRWMAGDRASRSRRQARRRLLFEPLENRRLLAAGTDLAAIVGTVFDDFTGDGFSPGEEVASATVNLYADTNANGTFEPGAGDVLQTSTTTNASGQYRFSNLTAGSYFVQQPAQSVSGSTLLAANSNVIVISASAVQGTTIRTIDTFNTTTQSITDSTNDAVAVTDSAAASEAIGGERDLFVNLTSAAGALQLSANDPLTPGVLTFNTTGAATGERVITWDGTGGGAAAVNDTGLGGIDLTSTGTATGFNLTIGADLAGGTLEVLVYSDDGAGGTATRFSTATIALPVTGGSASALEYIPFSSFTTGGGGGANFASVGAIEAGISGVANLDAEIDLVTVVGPTLFTQNFSNFESADLSLTKSVSNATPNVGDSVTFTLTLANAGPDAASNVSVGDTLPTGMTFVTSSPSQGSYNSGTGIWTVGSVASGGNATLQIVATVTSTGTKTNTTQVTAADQFDPDSTPNNSVAMEDDQDSASLTPTAADLSLTKTVDNPSPNVGESVTFTLTLANAGPDGATNVTVGDSLPVGMTFVSSTPSQGTYISGTGVWTVGSVASGGSATLQIVASVTATGTQTNTAQVTASDQADPDSTPNNNVAMEDDQDSAGLTASIADLSLTKAVDNASPNVGDNITFTLTAANAGPDSATNVAVTDVLPAGLTFVSSTPSQGTFVSGTGVWTVGTIANGGNATLQIVATVASVGAKTNSAQVTASDQADSDSTPNNGVASEDDQESVVVTPQLVDLSLTKSVDVASPNVGDNVTFTLTLANAGPNSATNAIVTDALPTGLTFVSSTPSQGSYDSGTGAWTAGTIASGANATLQITAAVASSGTKTNTTQVTSVDQADSDSTPNNSIASEDDQAAVSVTPQVADLSIAKTVSNATPDIGDNVTFTVTVSNAGPDSATNVTVMDTFPTGMTFVSATPSQGIYDNTTGVWTVGTVANAANPTLLIVATVAAAMSQTNTAEIAASDQFDPDSTPNNGVTTEDDLASILLTPTAADLSLAKTVSNATPNVGDNVTFTLTASNAGPDTATNVAVTDSLPTGLTFVSATPSQGTYSDTTGLWTVGSIGNGAAASLQIVATVASTGAKTNSAQVTASDQTDPDSTVNNGVATEDDQASVAVTPQVIDLSLAKTIDNATPNVRDNVTFTITVSNAGPDAASGVTVLDAIPAGMTFVSSTPSQGSYVNGTGVWTVGTIANGANATLQIVASVDTVGTKTNSAQVTAADQTDSDSTPGNSIDTEDDQASIMLTPQDADLSLTKTVDDTTPNSGQNVTFTVTVSNAGPSSATNVVVQDSLPAGLTFVSSTPSQGTFDNATGQWAVGTMVSGGSATLQIVASVTTIGAKTNVAQVQSVDQNDPDSTPNNSIATEDDQAEVVLTPEVADLSVTQTVNNANVNVGDNVIFTIEVSNAGPQDATNVAVRDTLPTGMSFVSSAPSQGSFDNTTGIWAVGSVANGASATLMITASVDTLGIKTNLAQVSAADQFDSDSTPDNSVDTEDDQAGVLVIPPRTLSKRAFLSR
ncbi:MAG: DUF11 domain-containing protein [Planctomycetaceae bacterium]|nr:DUF11 domain-containing protein [Planctomycetaceae bacterium]